MNANLTGPKSHPSFGKIDYSAVKSLLKNLSSKEVEEFAGLVEKQKNNSLVDVVLFEKGAKKFEANIADDVLKLRNDAVCKSYSQRIFESPVRFVKRCCGLADERAKKVEEIIKKNDMIDNLFS